MKSTKKNILTFGIIIVVCIIAAILLHENRIKERPNVLFIIVDTLRSDHLGCYGYGQIKTPNIDNLAKHGTLFKDTISQTPLTFPSHVDIFTSTYPNYNKMRDNGGFRLGKDAVTLAQILKKNGYATAAFVSTIVLDSKYGLNKGFDVYDDKLKKSKEKQVLKLMDEEKTADKTTEAAASWLTANKDKRFFLWVHYFDPHTIYNPPSPYKEIYKDNLYNGEIAFTDEYIGKLLNTLEELGLTKNTLIIFASDHGEGLNEHGELGHGIFIYDATLKVPLIFSYPGLIPESKDVQTQVRLVDITPTILEFLHIKKSKFTQGKSLLGLIKGNPTAPDRPAYSESLYAKYHFNWDELKSWRTGEWKYIKSSEPELYDITNDPHELINLAGQKPDIVKKLDRDLEKFLKKTSSSKKEQKMEIDKETKEKLMSLGYIQGTVTPEAGGVVPRKMVAAMEKMNLLDRLANNGKVKEAIEGYNAILKADPNNIEAHRHMAQCYKELQNYDEAIKHFKKAASFKPDDVETHIGLGNVYKNMGRVNEAFDEFSLAQLLDKDDPAVLNNLGWCYQQKNEFDKAMEYYTKTLAIDPKISITHANMAIIYRVKGDIEMAIKEAKLAIELEPKLALAYSELGACMATKGNIDAAIGFCQKAVELDPSWPDGFYNLGVCYEWKGLNDEALENYNKALELAPWNPNLYSSIAGIYLRLKQYDKAAEYAKKALLRAPNFKKAAGILNKATRQDK